MRSPSKRIADRLTSSASTTSSTRERCRDGSTRAAPDLVAAALFHDVIEDSDSTDADLLKRGIPQSVIDIVGNEI